MNDFLGLSICVFGVTVAWNVMVRSQCRLRHWFNFDYDCDRCRITKYRHIVSLRRE